MFLWGLGLWLREGAVATASWVRWWAAQQAGCCGGPVSGELVLTRSWQGEELWGIRTVASGVPAPPVKL